MLTMPAVYIQIATEIVDRSCPALSHFRGHCCSLRNGFSNQVISNYRGGEDTRQASTRMRSCADKIQVVEFFGSVMRPEPRRLRQSRLQGKGRSLIAVQRILEMQRIDGMFC